MSATLTPRATGCPTADRRATGACRTSPAGRRFRLNERSREDVAAPGVVAELLEEVDHRRETWEAIRALVPGGKSLPVLASSGGTEDGLAIDPDAWSLLCKVNSLPTVAELARDGGFTLCEVAGVVSTLVTAGLVGVTIQRPRGPSDVSE